MSALFWLDWRAFDPDPNNLLLWKTWRSTHATHKNSSALYLPPFLLTGVEPWLGASFIILEFRATASAPFSLLGPIRPPANVNFCLAVRWVTGDLSSSYAVHRYKLWQDVGEDLDYPLYGGQTIGQSFALEIWTTQTFENQTLGTEGGDILVTEDGDIITTEEAIPVTVVSLDHFIQLITSILYDPAACCDESNPVEAILEPYCALFALDSVEILTTEDGDIITTEDGSDLII